jgi:hypothetical protein
MLPRFIKASELQPGDTIVWYSDTNKTLQWSIISETMEEYETAEEYPAILMFDPISKSNGETITPNNSKGAYLKHDKIVCLVGRIG